LWRKFIRPGDTVLDAGAYIGLISIHFAALGAKVIAIEGSKRNSERLRKMAESFSENIEVHEIAISDKEESCTTKFNDCVDREHPLQEIKYVRYDDYARKMNLPDPSYVKMDIEGMETLALKGMERLIYETRPVWQIEFHKEIPFKYDGYPGYVPTEDGGFDFEEFERNGYVVLDERGKRTKTKHMECFKNYFFVPSKIIC
jgi:FkbM family methyltransferase